MVGADASNEAGETHLESRGFEDATGFLNRDYREGKKEGCLSSPWYNQAEGRAGVAWKEGVVEQLQRYLRPTILVRLNVQPLTDVFQNLEQEHPFSPFIEALEPVMHFHRFCQSLTALPNIRSAKTT